MLRYTYITSVVVCMCLVLSTDCYFFQAHNFCFIPELWSTWEHIERLALTLNLLTTTIVAPPSNASKWQIGFNSAFKGLNVWK
jgi:hypothetical protein